MAKDSNILVGDGADEVFLERMRTIAALREENARLLAAIKRAEYYITGEDYLDGLRVLRKAIETTKENDK